MDVEQLLNAWRVNNVVTLEMLDAVSDEDLELKPGKGKTIRSNIVHLIGVRRMWLEVQMPKEAKSVPKLDWKTANRKEMRDGLIVTSKLMAMLFEKMESSKKKGKWSTPLFFAYCIAHEANHRSQIEIALRINGREPDEGFLYGLWEWPKK